MTGADETPLPVGGSPAVGGSPGADSPAVSSPTVGNPTLGSPAVRGPTLGGPTVGNPLILRREQGGESVGGNFYLHVGGRPTFEKLVRVFYDGVADDEVLRPLYPEEDLEGAIQRLTGFLEQYWGGPSTYSEERGHPRLRMRHLPFKVNPEARDRWLLHMRTAVDSLDLSPLDDATLWAYLERAAHAMVNTFEE